MILRYFITKGGNNQSKGFGKTGNPTIITQMKQDYPKPVGFPNGTPSQEGDFF